MPNEVLGIFTVCIRLPIPWQLSLARYISIIVSIFKMLALLMIVNHVSWQGFSGNLIPDATGANGSGAKLHKHRHETYNQLTQIAECSFVYDRRAVWQSCVPTLLKDHVSFFHQGVS